MFKRLLVTLVLFGVSACDQNARPQTPEVKEEVAGRFKIQMVRSDSIKYIMVDRQTGCEFAKLDGPGGPALLRCEDSLKEKY